MTMRNHILPTATKIERRRPWGGNLDKIFSIYWFLVLHYFIYCGDISNTFAKQNHHSFFICIYLVQSSDLVDEHPCQVVDPSPCCHKTILVIKFGLAVYFGLWNLCIDHGLVDQQQDVDKGGIGHIEIRYHLKCQAFFPLFGVLILFFFDLLDADIIPFQHHVVTVVQKSISILNIHLNIAIILNTDQLTWGYELKVEYAHLIFSLFDWGLYW